MAAAWGTTTHGQTNPHQADIPCSAKVKSPKNDSNNTSPALMGRGLRRIKGAVTNQEPKNKSPASRVAS